MKTKLAVTIVALCLLAFAVCAVTWAALSMTVTIPYSGTIPSPTPAPTPTPSPTPTPTVSASFTLGQQTATLTSSNPSATFSTVDFGTFNLPSSNFNGYFATLPISIHNTGNQPLTATLAFTNLPSSWNVIISQNSDGTGTPITITSSAQTFPVPTSENFSGFLTLIVPSSTNPGAISGTATLTLTSS